jgi:hypothetical protein
MIFFDVFFYTVFQKKRKDRDSAIFSACAIMSLWFGLFICMITHAIGFINDNPVSRWTLDNAFLACAMIGIVCYICFIIRYFKFASVESIKKKIEDLPNGTRIFIKTVVWLFIITVLPGSFVFYRLYMFGYV